MSLVSLPNLQDLIDNISYERNLPKHAVEKRPTGSPTQRV
jgi:N utilization substance protein A